MNTDAGMVAILGLLLLRVTVTPDGGAAGDKLSVNGTDWPGPTATLDGRLRFPGAVTFTTTFAGATFGALPVAVMVVAPTASAITGTFVVVALDRKLTEVGTVAALRFEDVRLTVKPLAGAGADRVNVRLKGRPAAVDNGPCGKLSAAPTSTCLVADTYPVAVAVMLADPKLMPFTVG